MILLFIYLLTFMTFGKDDVCNKMLRDKFFRGIVADNLAQDISVIKETECPSNTYSELRSCLILWIENNLDKACSLFKKHVESSGGFVVNTTIYEYYINPRFKEFIDKMEDAAKGSMSSEEMRKLSSLLFDANYGNEENIGVEINERRAEVSDSKIDYYSLNRKALSDEIRTINAVWEHLSNYRVRDLGGIIRKTDDYYFRFTNYASVLRNLKGVDDKNLEKIISAVMETRRYLILKSILVKLRLNEDNFMARSEFSGIYNTIESEIYNLSLSTKTYGDFVREVFELWKKIDEMVAVISFLNKREEIINFSGFRYSCLMDYLFQLIGKNLLNLKFYRDMQSRIDELKNFFSKKIHTDLISDKYTSMYDSYKKLSQQFLIISTNHRRSQYLFWDNLLPFDLYFHKERLYFGIKIKEENLF